MLFQSLKFRGWWDNKNSSFWHQCGVYYLGQMWPAGRNPTPSRLSTDTTPVVWSTESFLNFLFHSLVCFRRLYCWVNISRLSYQAAATRGCLKETSVDICQIVVGRACFLNFTISKKRTHFKKKIILMFKNICILKLLKY